MRMRIQFSALLSALTFENLKLSVELELEKLVFDKTDSLDDTLFL